MNHGVLSEYLLDLETAAKLGRKPTGTGGFAGIEPNSILVLPGDLSIDDLVAGKGIIIDATMGRPFTLHRRMFHRFTVYPVGYFIRLQLTVPCFAG